MKFFDAVIVRGCMNYPIVIQVDDESFVIEVFISYYGKEMGM